MAEFGGGVGRGYYNVEYFYAGFADKGRLGIGSLSDWNPQNPFVNTPYLVEGLSKVFIKKVGLDRTLD